MWEKCCLRKICLSVHRNQHPHSPGMVSMLLLHVWVAGTVTEIQSITTEDSVRPAFIVTEGTCYLKGCFYDIFSLNRCVDLHKTPILTHHDCHCWFCIVILYSDWLTLPASFAKSAVNHMTMHCLLKTVDCDVLSCQNEILTLTPCVNGDDFALGQTEWFADARANHPLWPSAKQPHLHLLFMLKSFNSTLSLGLYFHKIVLSLFERGHKMWK